MPFTAAELIERRKYLGGSEAAAALGLSNFFTPLELYKDKIGEGTPIEETIPMMVGTALEPVVLRLFERETGLTVSRQQERVVDPNIPWRRATLDGMASDGFNIQAKTSGVYGLWGKEEDGVPPAVIYQCQHEMACSGAPASYVPVILQQRTFTIYQVKRDDEMIEILTAGEADFMRHVHEKREPRPINADDLKILYPVDHGHEIVASVEVEKAAYDLSDVKAQLKVLEKQEKDLSFVVKEFMKEASLLKSRDGKPLYTFNSQIRNTIDVTRLRKEQPAIADAYNRESVVRVLLNKIK